MTDLDEDFLPGVEIFESVCAGLVTVDQISDVIRVVDYTAQEYFERTSLFPNAETDVTVTCVTYLSFDTFETGFCQTDEEFETRLQLNPLYDYASRYWGHHARAASTEAEQLILGFLANEAKISASSQAMMVSEDRYEGYSQGVPRQITGVHLAAYFGMTEMTGILLENKYPSDCKDSYGRTPLSYAAANGHEAVVRLLVERADVDADSKDNRGRTPLLWAAATKSEQWMTDSNHEAVLQLLLHVDRIDINFKDTKGRTPLSWAAESGQYARVKLLLSVDFVDPDSKDRNGRTPLSLAAANGHEAVVRLLVERDDVDADSKDYDGRTPLLWATLRGHRSVIRLLSLDNPAQYANKLEYPTARPADGSGVSMYEPSEVESTFSDIDSVRSSNSSVGEVRFSAVLEISDLFLRHSELQPLYDIAITKVGPEKFERNFKRFLQRYGRNLKHEASSQLEIQAAKFVRATTRQIAAEIKRSLTKEVEKLTLWRREPEGQSDAVRINEWLELMKNEERRNDDQIWQSLASALQESPKNEPMMLEDTQDLSDASGSDESDIHEDTSFYALDNLKSFMISGEAFTGLCEAFRQWLESSEDQKKGFRNNQNKIAREILDPQDENVITELEASSANGEQLRHKIGSVVTEKVHVSPALPGHSVALVNQIPPSDFHSNALPFPLSFQTCRLAVLLLDTVMQSCKLSITMLRYLWQPNVPPGYVQVSWTCRCGKRLRADFRETDRAAAVEFAKQAAGPSNSRTVSHNHSESETSASSSSSQNSNSEASPSGNMPGTPPFITPSDDDDLHDPIIPPWTKQFLLLCVNSSIHCINLTHVDVTHIGHDEVLFQHIKAAYTELRGNKAKNVLVVAKTMQYIEFELILRQKSRECVGNFEKDSIPPEEKVLKKEYSFKPCPPTIGKLPIPPHIFMHSFQEPGDHTGSLAVERLPKKLREKLSCRNNQLNVPVGWGIYIIEGYNWRLIIRCAGGAFLATFVLAVLWCFLKEDVQGGMGIGQYSIAALALALAMFVSEKI